VIESRLTKWLEKAFLEHGNDLKAITGSVAQTGEGAWTAATAKALKIAAPIIEGSVKFRKQSEKKPSYTGKVLSALRGQFGGHATR
jgi:6-phosphogluconate dehydrogenase